MSKIEEMMQRDFWETEIFEHPAQAFEQGYKIGVNAVLEEIEKCLSYTIPLDEVFTHIELTIADLKGE